MVICMVWGVAVSTLVTFRWIWNHVSSLKVHNLVSVYPKVIKLAQMTTLNVIIHAVVSDC